MENRSEHPTTCNTYTCSQNRKKKRGKKKKNATSKSDTTMKNKREKEGKRSSMEDDGDLERESGNVYRMGGEETRLIDGMGGGSFTFAVLA